MTLRRVMEDEVDGILEWSLPQFRFRYPRATVVTMTPYLKYATRCAEALFIRSENAAGLFEAVRLPWVPLIVNDVAVVSQKVAPFEVKRIYLAGKAWAEEIGACDYNYGTSTGIDLEPLAKAIGYSQKWQGYTLHLKAA